MPAVGVCEKIISEEPSAQPSGCGRDLYPGDTECRSCGKPTPAWLTQGIFVCPTCRADVHPLEGDTCANCGNSVSNPPPVAAEAGAVMEEAVQSAEEGSAG